MFRFRLGDHVIVTFDVPSTGKTVEFRAEVLDTYEGLNGLVRCKLEDGRPAYVEAHRVRPVGVVDLLARLA